jgi:anaerobic magnesium-protoporphyrin IX monomethyl ester cyclase
VYRHVLCVYPYRRELRQWMFCPPLGLEFIAAAFRPYTSAVDVRDLRKESAAATTRDFLRPETDVVCFSINWERDIEQVRREISSVPAGPLVVVGGRHASECPERWLGDCPNINILVRGDGEEAIDEICRGVPLAQIAGISYRADGRIFHNAVRVPGPLRDDLYPDRGLRHYSYYAELEGRSTGLLFDTLASSRGCPYHCKFCSFNRNPWGAKRNWSCRSPESVIEELSQIKAPFVAFMDDNFTHDAARVERICDLLIERGIRKKYIINARIEIAKHPALLKKMERAGFMLLLLGIESAQDKTLLSIGKGFNTAKIREYFQVLRRSRMILLGYFIVGMIGESAEEMRQIAPFARELGLDLINLTQLRITPYSGLEELVAGNPNYHIQSGGKIYSDECSYDKLCRIRREIGHAFYTPAQYVRVARKAVHHGALKHLPLLLWRAPGMCYEGLRNSFRHRRRRAQRARAAATVQRAQ